LQPVGSRLSSRWALHVAAGSPWSMEGDGAGGWVGGTEGRDPWDQPFVVRQPAGGPLVCYSPGANGVDERGGGDDVPVDLLSAALVRKTPWILGGLALLVLVCWRGPFTRRARSPQLWREALRAACLGGLALVPCAVLFAIGVFLNATLDLAQGGLGRGVPGGPALPASLLGLFGTLALGCFMGALAWRLNRPLEEAARASSGQPAQGPKGASESY
jgi:hypothetical protein